MVFGWAFVGGFGMQKTFVAATIVALVGMSGTAIAADFGNRGGYYGQAAYAAWPVFGGRPLWSGFYIGVNGGGGWATNDDDITFYDTKRGAVFTSRGPNAEGAFGGGQIGYNWRGILAPCVVLGVEADLQGSGISDDVSGTTITGLGTFRAGQSLDWFGSVRGRIGYAFDPALFYVTGGFAFGGVQDEAFLSDLAGHSATLSQSDTQTGYTVGGGVEYAINPAWFLKAEYQYINLGGETLSGNWVPGADLIHTSTFNDGINTFRVGLNWRIPTGPATFPGYAPSYRPLK
jgi:outer membrane immunogenic protein